MLLVERWAKKIAERNKKELLSNRVYSYFEDNNFYGTFLRECKRSGLTLEQAEEIWFIANREANNIE